MRTRYRWVSIISWYVSREFASIFFLSVAAFNAIYLIIDFFESVRRFFEYHAPMGLVLQYYLWKIPIVTFQTLPLAVLLSTLITLGMLSRHMEITAMKASGISLYQITRPIILISVLIAFITFFGNEYLAPYAHQESDHIMNVEVRKGDSKVAFKNFNIWYRQDATIYNFQAFYPNQNSLKGISVYYFDKDFRLLRRLDADEAVWDEERWILHDVTVRDFTTKNAMGTETYPVTELSMGITPDNLSKIEKDTEEMGYSELKRYVRRLKKVGYDATRYTVDLQIKLAFPFINLIMVLIGIPFALKTGRTGGFAAGVGISLAVGFTYWVLISVIRAFGHAGILPPLLSAWSPHLLFGGAGVVALLSIRQ